MLSTVYFKFAVAEVENVINPTWWRLLLPIAYMTGIFALSSVPGNETETAAGALLEWITPKWQNLLHIPAYAALTLCWIWALSPLTLTRIGLLVIAALLTLVWAVLDEAHQASVPGRYGSLTDLLLNLTGAILAVAYAWQTGFARAKTAVH